MKLLLSKRILHPVKDRLQRFTKKGLRKILPNIYILLVVLGLILAGFYPFFPKFTFCSSLFGETFCTPVGFFIAMIASVPGYLIVGNILKFFPPIAPILSVLMVVIVSLFSYFLLGVVIESLASKNKTSSEKLKILIILVFFLLGFFAISFA